MSDSERVVAFRSDVPFPSPARLAPGRERLLAAATTAGPGSAGARRRARQGPFLRVGPFLRWRPLIAVSAAVAVTAGTGYALLAHAGQATPSASSATPSASSATPSASSATPSNALAVKVLTEAANVVRRSTVTEPSPGQWIFYENTTVSHQNPVPRTSDPEWITFDGGHTAYYDGPHGTGPLVVHTNRTKFPPPGMSPWTALDTYGISLKIAWDVLNSLPASPKAVLAAVAEHTPAPREVRKNGYDFLVRPPGCERSAGSLFGAGQAGTVPTPAQREFECLASLMWNAEDGLGGPPAGDAAAFGAMAALPGISVQEGITDAAGAPAIAVFMTGSYHQLVLNPVTYQVIGMRWISSGIAPGPRRPGNSVPYPPKGALLFSTARVDNKLVAAPGDR